MSTKASTSADNPEDLEPPTPIDGVKGLPQPGRGKASAKTKGSHKAKEGNASPTGSYRPKECASDCEECAHEESRLDRVEHLLNRLVNVTPRLQGPARRYLEEYDRRDDEEGDNEDSTPRGRKVRPSGNFGDRLAAAAAASPNTTRSSKRQRPATNGYSDTDSNDEDSKWEIEQPEERAERYESMRIACMASTTNTKAKAIREQQKSLFKPLMTVEELIGAVKKCDVADKRGIIRRGREARKIVQNRWDELIIAEKHGFDVVESYKMQKATGKDKSLAAALKDIAKTRSYSAGAKGAGSGRKGGGHNNNYNSGYRQRSPRRSPSPRRARARSPRRSPPRSSSSSGYGSGYYSQGGGGGYSGHGGYGGYGGYGSKKDPRYANVTCHGCGRHGHFQRNCPDRP